MKSNIREGIKLQNYPIPTKTDVMSPLDCEQVFLTFDQTIVHAEKNFSWLKIIVFQGVFGWFEKIFWLDELNFCSSDQTLLLKWTKAFGSTLLLALQNILLMLRHFFGWIYHMNLCWLTKKIIWHHQTHVGSRKIFIGINQTFLMKKLCWVNQTILLAL